MSWNDHVNNIITRISKIVGILAKFKYFLPTAVKLHIYNSLFMSQLNYCSLVWGNTTKTNLNRMHVLQKKAIRHIAGVEHNAHTKNLFNKLNLISVHNLYNFNLAKTYKSHLHHHDTFITSIANLTAKAYKYPTRSQEIWTVPFSRTAIGNQMIRHTLPSLLNHLAANDITTEHANSVVLKNFFVTAE